MIDILSDIDTGSAVPEAFPALEAKYGDVRLIFKKYKKFWILLVPKASEASDGEFLFFYQL